METIRNEEINLSEDDEYDDESNDSEGENAEADPGILSMTPPEAHEEESGEKRSTVEETSSVHSSSSRTPFPSPGMSAAPHFNDIKDIVSSDLTKERARQQRKHHSKRGARHAGRAKGSKAKQDTRVKLDRGGMWD
jgi:RIO kinase 2